MEPVREWTAKLTYLDLTGLVMYAISFTSEKDDFGQEDVIPQNGLIALLVSRYKQIFKERHSGKTLQEKLQRLDK